jgi:branched-chain amino acid transport system permease protein
MQVVALEWRDVTGGALGLYGVPVTVTTAGLIAAVGVASAILWYRERGSSGRMLESMRLDEQLAPTLGVNVMRRRHEVFALSGLLGATAGVLYVLLYSTITPDQAGFGLIITALTIIVIGGISSWTGALVGAFIVTWLPEWLEFAGEWRSAVEGGIIVLMVIWVPDGLVGLLARARRSLAGYRMWLRRPAPSAGGEG